MSDQPPLLLGHRAEDALTHDHLRELYHALPAAPPRQVVALTPRGLTALRELRADEMTAPVTGRPDTLFGLPIQVVTSEQLADDTALLISPRDIQRVALSVQHLTENLFRATLTAQDRAGRANARPPIAHPSPMRGQRRRAAKRLERDHRIANRLRKTLLARTDRCP